MEFMTRASFDMIDAIISCVASTHYDIIEDIEEEFNIKIDDAMNYLFEAVQRDKE